MTLSCGDAGTPLGTEAHPLRGEAVVCWHGGGRCVRDGGTVWFAGVLLSVVLFLRFYGRELFTGVSCLYCTLCQVGVLRSVKMRSPCRPVA